ncbi:MAG: hypothetical protein AMJ81_09115 [Phycisphaerae bacterium SM23_33]|nr:MAG: hypothetical protein AMJ81_09115 [Phycisphaerae bacterium SM23_33]
MKFVKVERLRFVEYRRPDQTDLDEDTTAMRSREESRKNYYAFTSLAYSPQTGELFCGMTNFGNDLLYVHDPASGEFESANYAAIADPHEVKIHRGLWLGGDGCVYSATSSLSGLDELAEAPGGKLFRFDPGARRLEVLGIPAPHLYIQTVSLDWARRMMYGMAYPRFDFFAFSLERREVAYRCFVGSICHVGAVDDEGGYWGTWLGGGGRHDLFRYDPGENRIRFFPHGFPTPCRSLMYRGAGPIDSMVNGGDGYLYVGHETGELYRIEWRTGRVEYLCKPLPGRRMPGLAAAEDGLLLGVGGNDRAAMGFAYDRKTGNSEILGGIRDESADADCFRTHDCCLVGNTLFVGETDNPRRSCYLWKCTLG